jgi:hypothetical protein
MFGNVLLLAMKPRIFCGLSNVEELAAKFDVSVPAMKRRLRIRS